MDLSEIDVEMFAKCSVNNNYRDELLGRTCGVTKNKMFGKDYKPRRNNQRLGRRLRLAAGVNDTSRAQELLTEGANPNDADEQGRTALHIAASRGFNRIVSLLINFNANPNLEDRLGNTPLHLAVYTGSVDTVFHLLRGGCQVRRTANLSLSPLELAQCRFKGMADYYANKEPRTEMAKILGLLQNASEIQRNLQDDLDSVLSKLSNINLDSTSVENFS